MNNIIPTITLSITSLCCSASAATTNFLTNTQFDSFDTTTNFQYTPTESPILFAQADATDQPVDIKLQAYYNIEHPDSIGDYTFRVQLQFLFPKKPK